MTFVYCGQEGTARPAGAGDGRHRSRPRASARSKTATNADLLAGQRLRWPAWRVTRHCAVATAVNRLTSADRYGSEVARGHGSSCDNLHLVPQQQQAIRTAPPDSSGLCAAPPVLVPESFRMSPCVAPSVDAGLLACISLQSAKPSLAVRQPERLWEFAPSAEPAPLAGC